MLAGGNIPDLVECVDLATVRVHAPAPVIFICGGKTDASSVVPRSLRDAFMRVVYGKPFSKHEPLLAEELNAFFPNGNYRDILTFERDIAQICDLILLFSESYGSAAELGAFAVSDDISQRLLVVIDDFNYSENSFVALGPLRMLQNQYGDGAVCVIHRQDIGISSIEDVSSMNIDDFKKRLGAAFEARIAQTHERTTFNINRTGHIIKFAVGLIQHYSALTIDEIDVYLFEIGVSRLLRSNLSDLLLCAELARWIKKDKRGIFTYYLPVGTKEALQYKVKRSAPKMEKFRWRADIVEYWRAEDIDRSASISSISNLKP